MNANCPNRRCWLAPLLGLLLIGGCYRSDPPETTAFRAPVRPTLKAIDVPDTAPKGAPVQVAAAEPDAPPPPPPPKPTADAAPVIEAAPAADEPTAAAGPTLIGTWRMTSISHDGQEMPMSPGMEMTMTFAEGGKLTFSQSYNGESRTMTGTWSINGDMLTLTADEAGPEAQSGPYTLTGNTLEITIDEGTMRLTRI